MNEPRRFRLHQKNFLYHQWLFLNDWSKTCGLIGGLGSGKTAGFLFKSLICHINRPGSNGLSNLGIGYPSHKLGKALFYYPFCELLERAQIPFKQNLTELAIDTQFGKVSIMSMHTPERIIGETFTDVGLDELDTLPQPKGMLVVKRFRERLRGRQDSQLFIVSSPEGFSTCYNILKENPNPGTTLIHAKTTDNKYLPKGYIDDIKSTYDEQTARAYIDGQFVNLNSMQAHYAFRRDIHVHPVSMPNLGSQLVIGVDFNVNPMTAIVGYMRELNGEVHFYFFHEYYIRNSNTFMLSDLIADDYSGKYGIGCYPDPTGESRKTSADVSDIDILKRKGFNVHYKHGITQRRSLNIANGAFAHNRIHIDPRCKYLIADLEQVVTDETGQIEKPNGTMLTHISDAMRNVIAIETIQRHSTKGKEI